MFPKGIALGSLTLLTGEPGSGKSTLALQLARLLSVANQVLYVSAEEAASQVKERSDRIGSFGSNFSIAESTNLEEIVSTIFQHKPKVVCIDSLQTIVSAEVAGDPGSLNQLRAVVAQLMELARREQVAIIIIGHVTKDGTLAGPKSLEHLVDAVYYLEADRNSAYRLLRVYKNRFGASGTVMVMQMGSGGMTQVANPATIFIHNYVAKPGSVVTITEIDDQLFFIEVQALVAKSSFGYAKRTASGFSKSRLELLLAIIKKQLHVDADQYDIYINIAGGFSVHEPALDLAIIASILSSLKEQSIPAKTVVFGEVGLSGEIRVVKDTGARLKTIEEHGFTTVVFPPLDKKVQSKLKLHSCASVGDLVKMLGW
jgi:DNA repair protein RadA/Sms